MERSKRSLSRREVVKTLAATAAALRVGVAGAGRPEEKTISLNGAIPARPLGRSGHTLPILAMGGAPMLDRYSELTGVPKRSVEERAAMFRHGYERGLRYVDTARNYGNSESIIGMGLEEIRDDMYLATKVAVRDPSEVRASVETSLRELRTSYIDCIQIHGQFLDFEPAMKVHAELVKFREQGMCRFIGLTGHDRFDRMYRKICTGEFDQVMLAYGYFQKGMTRLLTPEDVAWRDLCIAKAHELGMGIVAMKVMGGWVYGHNASRWVPDFDSESLPRLRSAAIRWVLADPRIDLLNIGVCLPSEIDDNIATLRGDTALTEADRLVLADFSSRAYASDAVRQGDRS